jgi:hypothetical protein
MTAAELFEVVKDVPREAWPELTWDGVEWSNSRRDEDISARIAEHAFIGSMTAWLAGRGFFPTCNVWDDGKDPRASVLINNRQMSHGGTSLVAALAAACKEAA